MILNSNEIEGDIASAGLENLTALTNLQIAANKLIGKIPDAFANLVNIEHFRFHENNLDRDAKHDAFISSVLNNRYTDIPSANKNI